MGVAHFPNIRLGVAHFLVFPSLFYLIIVTLVLDFCLQNRYLTFGKLYMWLTYFSWLIYFYFMVTNFYSFYKKEKIIINNCGCLCNCSPEPEFIEETVETIWKTIYVESPTSTIPPCRQNDVPNAIAGRTHRLFFFFLKLPHGNFRE